MVKKNKVLLQCKTVQNELFSLINLGHKVN